VAQPEFKTVLILIRRLRNVFHTIWVVYPPIIGIVQEDKESAPWTLLVSPLSVTTISHATPFSVNHQNTSHTYNSRLFTWIYILPTYLCSCFEFMNQMPILFSTQQLVKQYRPTLPSHIFLSTISMRPRS